MQNILNKFKTYFTLRSFSKRVTSTYAEALGENLVSIILFGSHARGEAQPKSDYDLFIIAEELPAGHIDRITYIRKPIAGKFKERISIISKTTKEVESGFPSLFLDLGVDGIILYDNNYFRKKKTVILDLINKASLFRERLGNSFRWRFKNQPKGIWEIGWSGVNAK